MIVGNIGKVMTMDKNLLRKVAIIYLYYGKNKKTQTENTGLSNNY